MLRPPRRSTFPDREEGGLWVMEALVFAILILAGIAFVVTFETPTTDSESFIGYLQTIGEDSLQAWAAQAPVDPHSPFPTRLEQFVAEALMGDTRNVSEYFEAALPLGTMWRLSLETGNGTLWIAGEEEPPPFTYPRGVASREFTFRPSATFLDPDFAIQDGVHAMRPAAIVIDEGQLVRPGAIPIEVRVTYVDGDERTHRSTVYSSQAASATATVPSASLYFGAAGAPVGGLNLDPTGNLRANLLLSENAPNAQVGVGAQLIVRVPTGWDDVECYAPPTTWSACEFESYGANAGGTLAVALVRPVDDETVQVWVNATYADAGPTRLPFSLWRSELGGDNAAVAELLVTPADASAANVASPIVGVTMPNPLGDTGSSHVVVAFGNGGEDEILLTKIELEALDGSPLWRLDPQPGWSVPAPHVLQWSDEDGVPVGPRAWEDEKVTVRPNRLVASSPYSTRTVPLEFDHGFRLDMARFQRDAVSKDIVPATTAASPGYPEVPGSHTMRTGDGAPRGSARLEVMPLPESSLMSELYDAHLTSRLGLDRTELQPGETVRIIADYSAVMGALADQGSLGDRDVTVTTNIYSPATFVRKVPWKQFVAHEEELGHPPIWFLEILDVNDDGTDDLLVAKGKALYALDGRSADLSTRFWKRSFDGNTNALFELVDLDGDGETEALLATSAGEVHLLDVRSGETEQERLVAAGVSAAAVGGDCDGDGRSEIYIGTVEVTGKPHTSYDGPSFVGLDDLSAAAQAALQAGVEILESDGARLQRLHGLDLGRGTKVRDFANGTISDPPMCGFAVAEANGLVRAYGGDGVLLWEHETGVPFERGGATQVVIVETDVPGHPDHGLQEVVYGDGDGWITALNSTRPAAVPRVLDLSFHIAPGDALVDVDMVSADVGFAVTEKGTIFKTNDRWVTGIPTASDLAAQLVSQDESVVAFDFFDETNGCVAASRGGIYFGDGLALQWLPAAYFSPGFANDVLHFGPSDAAAAVENEGQGGLYRFHQDAPEAARYRPWPSGIDGTSIAVNGSQGLAGGSEGTLVRFDPWELSTEALSFPTEERVMSIADREDGFSVSAQDGRVSRYISESEEWVNESLARAPEQGLRWALAGGQYAYAVNLNGTRGYAYTDRDIPSPLLRSQVSEPGPFVGISRENGGVVAAATSTSIVVFPQADNERRWSVPASGAVERLEWRAGNEMVAAGRLSTLSWDRTTGSPTFLTELTSESNANFGPIGATNEGWAAGTYATIAGAAPVPIEVLPGRTPITLDTNLVEWHAATSASEEFPADSEYDITAIRTGAPHAVGHRGGFLTLLNEEWSSYHSTFPGDLTSVVEIAAPLPGALLYGEHIVQSQLTVKLSDGGPPVLQSASMINRFEVLPERGEYAPRLYTLHLLAWPTA